jgi:hypothetical protein
VLAPFFFQQFFKCSAESPDTPPETPLESSLGTNSGYHAQFSYLCEHSGERGANINGRTGNRRVRRDGVHLTCAFSAHFASLCMLSVPSVPPWLIFFPAGRQRRKGDTEFTEVQGARPGALGPRLHSFVKLIYASFDAISLASR